MAPQASPCSASGNELSLDPAPGAGSLLGHTPAPSRRDREEPPGAWSTRELAELAGTTVKSVRYYHQLELLDEPERLTNGYKQYEVRHLVFLLQITRLTDLGVPLAQIESIGSSVDDPASALRTIDAELAATIERLQRIRAELAAILENRISASLPAGFAAAGRDLSEADQSLLLIWSKVFDEGAMDDLKQMLIDSPRRLPTSSSTSSPTTPTARRGDGWASSTLPCWRR